MHKSSIRDAHKLILVGGSIVVLLVAVRAGLAWADVAGPWRDPGFVAWLSNVVCALAAVLVLVSAWRRREERGAWICVGLALAIYAAGSVYITFSPQLSSPSVPDLFWLSFYPFAFAGLLLLGRNRSHRVDTHLWLDGLIGSLVVGAFGAAILLPVLLTEMKPGLGVVVAVMYPMLDTLLLVTIIGVFALTGWTPDRRLILVGVGLMVNALTTLISVYLMGHGSYVPGGPLDSGWSVAVILIALAPWLPSLRRVSTAAVGTGQWRLVAMPVTFGFAAISLIAYDAWGEGINGSAMLLAVAALVGVIVRFAVVFMEHVQMLDRSRHEATTDALTGLSNRRRLLRDLEQACAEADPDRPWVLGFFDLDGFKDYNDRFGHPAGDQLLQRLGTNLGQAVSGAGSAYRIGGDEFCVLARVSPGDSAALLDRAQGALSEQGDGFAVQASVGVALLPAETDNPIAALALADLRMYACKGERQGPAVQQMLHVLRQALIEHEPSLDSHLDEVAILSVAVGARLGMTSEQLRMLRLVAELHDVGKLAIPESILHKPGPLDEAEWGFIREHTLIGERILAAAPALAPLAQLVRNTHERMDGGGYPDGLRGEEIPLAARVVAVCDAFHAMISDRPYQSAQPVEYALAELRRSAGGQFDPVIVEAFCAVAALSEDTPLLMELRQAVPA